LSSTRPAAVSVVFSHVTHGLKVCPPLYWRKKNTNTRRVRTLFTKLREYYRQIQELRLDSDGFRRQFTVSPAIFETLFTKWRTTESVRTQVDARSSDQAVTRVNARSENAPKVAPCKNWSDYVIACLVRCVRFDKF